MDTLLRIFPPQHFTLLAVILGMPLVGAFVNGVFGKRLGKDAVRLMALSALGTSFLAAVVAFLALHHQAHALHDPATHKVTSVAKLSWEAWRWATVSLREGVGSTTINVSFAIDPLNSVMMLVVTGVGFLIHLYASSYMDGDPGYYRFFSYLNLFVFSMLVLILGDSMPLLFVGWEGVGLCSYLLIGFWFTEEKNAEAGKKAFIANRVGDFGLLCGMAMLLYYTGALDFAGIHAGAQGLLTKVQIWPLGSGLPSFLSFLQPAKPVEVYAATLCGLALFLGCAGKSAQLPLYVWLPDAMAGPTPVSALIHAATMVTAGLYLVCRLAGVFVLSPAVMTTIATTGALTALLAASIGLVQHDIKKVLAYSTVSQLGYMFIGVGVGAFSDGFFHVFTHAFFKACLFLGAGSVIHAMHATIHDSDASQDMRNMGGLRKYMPFTHASYLLSCLAIAGVPLTAGFFSKDEILAKAFESTITPAHPLMWTPPAYWGKVLFAIGIIGATMTAFYMFRTYFLTFWGEFKGWRIVERHGHDDHGHDDHGHDHDALEPGTGREHLEGPAPHESPWQMTLPLMVLGSMAILAGYLNAKILGETLHAHGLMWLEHWLEPVFEHASRAVVVPAFNTSHAWTLAAPGMAAAAIGIGFAYYAYVLHGGAPTRDLAEKVPQLHKLLLDKWRVDELYEATAVGAVDELATTAVIADKWLVDGVVAKLTSALVKGLGFVLRLAQTGRVQVYAAATMVGLVAIGWFVWAPHPDAVVIGDPGTGAYKVQAAGGVGYKFKWDADGDGKPDTREWLESDTVEVKLEPGKAQNVTLYVVNSFRRTAKKTFQVARPKKDGQASSLDELNKQLEQLQQLIKD
ncbi:MAG: NADH-quinone oxidoreductase subunit L [Polyangiaceae bacterium]|nr:NADH-quinone oxidoreductase subunit L [Polyangiaceae bacterium]